MRLPHPAAVLVPALLLSTCRTAPERLDLTTLPGSRSPLVRIELRVLAGSAADPMGAEGLAALTASSIAQGGTETRSYAEILEALYPMAATVDVDVDREVTRFAATLHRDTLSRFTPLFLELFEQPGFLIEDFERNRQQLLSDLTATLVGDDELLGLEALQMQIFDDHPYGHPARGTVSSLKRLTPEDARAFYARHYTASNVVLGVAGGFPEGYAEELRGRLEAVLPQTAGPPSDPQIPAPKRPAGRRVTIVEKPSEAVGIHLGFPVEPTRADPDFYPLLVANSHLGEHRTFHGRLMQELRLERGLNYGTYSYIEYLDDPPESSHPRPGVPRRRQFFSIWIRPVEPDKAIFALRAALFELERLVERGLTPEELEATRTFLVNSSKLWARRLSERLGFRLDSRYYGMPPYLREIERRLAELDLEQVNDAIRRHLQSEDLEILFVAQDGAQLEEELRSEAPTPLRYAETPRSEILAADRIIAELPLRIAEIRRLSAAALVAGDAATSIAGDAAGR